MAPPRQRLTITKPKTAILEDPYSALRTGPALFHTCWHEVRRSTCRGGEPATRQPGTGRISRAPLLGVRHEERCADHSQRTQRAKRRWGDGQSAVSNLCESGSTCAVRMTMSSMELARALHEGRVLRR